MMSKRLDWDKADQIYPDPARAQPEEPLIVTDRHPRSAAELAMSAYFSKVNETPPNLDARGQLEHRIAEHERYLGGLKPAGTAGRRVRREVAERLCDLKRQLAKLDSAS